LRRTPLTDLLGTHIDLSKLSLSTLRLDRLQPGLRDRTARLSRRGKTLAYGGTALALAGIGGVTAAAATAGGPAPAAISATSHHLSVADAAGAGSAAGPSVQHAGSASGGAAAGAGVAQAGGAFGRVTIHHQAPHAAKHAAAAHAARHATAKSWKQVRDELAAQTSPRAKPGKLPLADRLVIGPSSGSQSYLPMTSSRMANATAIVHQALGRHMGLRAAVIAVATAMQESGLENISYGDRDSLGLFQQRPSMGWGTASQITTPSYAADAFLRALADHQKSDPSWAAQPLWSTAQAVQKSGFPYAYAKWEKQAAELVSAVAAKLDA
jgi:hypothetical protein